MFPLWLSYLKSKWFQDTANRLQTWVLELLKEAGDLQSPGKDKH